mmetsp:Transcript_775/g.830  ORF Transcript_775/g.830 Transcript_775/m.830 type:complete len:186 (+) Transcript_775:39-596(+)
MLIDSFYILEANGETIISKNFSGTSKDDIIREFFSYYAKNRENIEDLYPILNIKKNFCSFLLTADIIYVATFSRDNNLAQIFNMIHFVNALLKDTLDEVKAEKVRSNASKVIQMLESYLCNGYPLITEKYPLEKPIKDAGVIAKFEKAIKSGMDSSNQQANGFESYIDSLNDIRPTKWLVKNGSF